MKKITLVSTVFNEISRLEQTIHDIESQTVQPDEIVITDAGSKDGTFERLITWANNSVIKIKVLRKERCNVAEGRNLAIKNASNDLIVSTDFGCRFHAKWLESITKPFEDPSVEVVGGAFSVIETEIKSLASRANYILSDGYNSPIDNTFIPSSRSIAYYKYVWEKVGGYPEWLTLAADDLVFGMVVKSLGYPIKIVQEPYVYWGRHIEAKSYGKEAYRYGLGDGEANVNRRQFYSKIIETILRYFFVVFLAIVLIFSMLKIWTVYILITTILFIPGFRSYWYAFKMFLKYRSQKYNLQVFIYSLYLIELSRINYIKGYYKGMFKSTEIQKQQAKKLKAIIS